MSPHIPTHFETHSSHEPVLLGSAVPLGPTARALGLKFRYTAFGLGELSSVPRLNAVMRMTVLSQHATEGQ